jgi:branched-chain amino acid transport system permease protein
VISLGYVEDLSTIIGINLIVTLGIYLIMVTGQIQGGQAAFVGIGAYLSAVMTKDMGISFWIALLAAPIIVGLMGAGLSIIGLRLHYFFICVFTLSFGEAMLILSYNLPSITGGATGLYPIPLHTSLPLVLGILVITVFFCHRFDKSAWAIACRAMHDDEEAAEVMGINVKKIRIMNFGIGCYLAGIGGVLMAHYHGVIVPEDMGFYPSLMFLVYAAFGGYQTYKGPMAAAITLLIVPELLRFSVLERYILVGIIIIVTMICRPEGLITRRTGGEFRPFWTRGFEMFRGKKR